jgi:hypothetical protein
MEGHLSGNSDKNYEKFKLKFKLGLPFKEADFSGL